MSGIEWEWDDYADFRGPGGERHFGADAAGHHQDWHDAITAAPAAQGLPVPARAGGCGCDSCLANRPSLLPGPAPLRSADDGVDYDAQPGAVLLSRAYAQREADPLTRFETARDEAVAARPETRTMDGRAALAGLRARRNPDGSNLSGSAALAVIRAMADLGIAGIGHEPS